MLDYISKEILGWFAGIFASLTSAFFGLYMLDRKRISDLEKIAFVTKPEIDAIVTTIRSEFKQDHERLDDKIDRIEESLRDEIRSSHDSLQGGIDKIVNILLTRVENDRRGRE